MKPDQERKKIICCGLLKAELELWNELWDGLSPAEGDAYNAAGDEAVHALRAARAGLLP